MDKPITKVIDALNFLDKDKLAELRKGLPTDVYFEKPDKKVALDVANELANYILEFEHDDFYWHGDEPCLNHMYYKAYLWLNGEREANKMLTQAIEDFKNG